MFERGRISDRTEKVSVTSAGAHTIYVFSENRHSSTGALVLAFF